MSVKYTAVLGGDTIEIVEESIDGLEVTMKQLADGGGQLLESATTFKQLAMAKGAFTAPADSRPAAATSKPTSTPPPAGGRVPSCKHGEGKFAEGKNKKTGVPYSGYFCPGRYPDTCKPSKIG